MRPRNNFQAILTTHAATKFVCSQVCLNPVSIWLGHDFTALLYFFALPLIGLDEASCPGRWSHPCCVLDFPLTTDLGPSCLTQTSYLVQFRRTPAPFCSLDPGAPGRPHVVLPTFSIFHSPIVTP